MTYTLILILYGSFWRERLPPNQMEKHYIHHQGQTAWGLLSVSLVRDSEDNPIHFVSRVIDITERKQTEGALIKANEMALTAERTAKAGSWRWELPTNTVTWSENLCRLHGIEPEDFDGEFETVMLRKMLGTEKWS